jgi:hypothetical protein
MRTIRTIAVSIAAIAITGVIAGGAGYLLGSSRSAAPVPVASPAHGRSEPSIVVAERGLSEADLRRVVGGDAAAPAAGPDAPAAAQRAVDPAAYDDGMRRVQHAIARRSWTRDDATALSRALPTMSLEQRTAILHTLVPALNRGEIKLAYRGELF